MGSLIEETSVIGNHYRLTGELIKEPSVVYEYNIERVTSLYIRQTASISRHP